MLIFITILHVLLAVFMIFVILLQPGKDAGMGAAFGGGAATSAFGGRGAVTFLSKITAGCAVLFFLTSLGLSFVGMGTSVAARLPAPAAQPAAPSAPAPAAIDQPAEGAAPVQMAPAEQPAANPVPPSGPSVPAANDPAPANPAQ